MHWPAPEPQVRGTGRGKRHHASKYAQYAKYAKYTMSSFTPCRPSRHCVLSTVILTATQQKNKQPTHATHTTPLSFAVAILRLKC